jgi:hypothetical protein
MHAPNGRWCGRRLVRSVGAAHRQLFDLGFDHLSAEEQLGYQAAVYVEGHCGWADRGRVLMASGSVLLWQETMCREWYSLLLQPWVHYVPVTVQ